MKTTMTTINERINLRANLIKYYSRRYGRLSETSVKVNKLILMGISFE